MSTGIQYCDETINPIRTSDGGYHCTKISPGCAHCFGEGFNKRFGNHKPYNNTPVEFVINWKALEKPLHWKKTKRIFVQDMSDLFHTGVPFWMIDDVIDSFLRVEHHNYLILTKHIQRMYEYFDSTSNRVGAFQKSNSWLGISAENQKYFNERWDYLKQIPSAMYWVSYEPALGPLILPPDFLKLGKRAFVVCGAETGPGARPTHPDWVRKVRDDCVAAGVPFWFKSWGEWKPINRAQMMGSGHFYDWGDIVMQRVGKKESGNRLDGKTWEQLP